MMKKISSRKKLIQTLNNLMNLNNKKRNKISDIHNNVKVVSDLKKHEYADTSKLCNIINKLMAIIAINK